MEVLLIWLTTILISFGIHCKKVLAFAKMFADQGIKFRRDAREEDTSHNQVPVLLFLPFLNVVLSIQDYFSLKSDFDDILYSRQYDVMSRFEKREYEKKKTGFHAFSVFKMYDQLMSQACVFYSQEREEGEIYFLPTQDDVVILQATGDFIYFSDDELKRKCMEAYLGFTQDINQLLEEAVGADTLEQLQHLEKTSLTEDELKEAYEKIFDKLVEEKMIRLEDHNEEEVLEQKNSFFVRSRKQKKD